MIDFYNAFISYRHAKLDSAIAEHIQRRLEHFHVPHKLKSKLKHTRITRIFRDKDELPITSDLTETITNALRQAEYLIVICSTNTKESYWVKREINTFLQTHTADRILTVLCDGEPFDVIPEELLSMEKEYQDENGIKHTVKVPVEPLSCDYRLKRSIADRDELPRLASALLGCSYDELQRRNRQYRIRRAAAAVSLAFAALVAFGCYMGYTSKQINDSYIDSLRSRSLYLANESEQLLAEGKRFDAIHLALAALPDGPKDKMPLTAQAERAATLATGSYNINSGVSFAPVWNYKTQYPVKKLLLTEDTFHLAAMDRSGDIYCWDNTTHELVFGKSGSVDQVDFLFPDNDSILIVYEYRIEDYNIKTGSLMWTFESKDSYPLRVDDIKCAAHSIFIDNGDGSVSMLSGRDGSVKNTYKLIDSLMSSIHNLTVSPDGKKIAYCDLALTFNNEEVFIYDTETGKISSSEIEAYIIWDMDFLDNDHLCIMSRSGSDFSNESMTGNNGMVFRQTGHMDVYCFDASMKQLWKNELAYNDIATGINSMYIPSRDAVLYYTGDTAVICDVKTGSELNSYQTGSSIITAGDFNSNGSPEFICRHGEYLLALGEDNNGIASYSVLCDKITTGIADDFIYAVQDGSSDIICYYRFLEDDGFTEIDAYGTYTSGTNFQASYYDDDYLIIGAKLSDTDDVRVSVIDINAGKLLFSKDVEAENGLLQNFSIENIDGTIYGIFGYSIYVIDPEDESVEYVDVSLDFENSVSNGKIITINERDSRIELNVSDLDGSSGTDISSKEIDDLDIYADGRPVFVKELNQIFIPYEDRLFVADLSSEKIREMDVPEVWKVDRTRAFYVMASDDGSRILFSDGNTILVTDSDLKEIYTIRSNYQYRCSAVFKKDILYVVADGYLFLYNAKTGELKDKYEMTLYGDGRSDLMFDDPNHRLYFITGDQISVFDTESWVEVACVKNAYCYHPGTGRFYVYSFLISAECTPGYFKQYTLEELTAKAKQMVAGQELPVEIRSEYGI